MKIALALGGGAALGWAHLGALGVLADAGMEVAAVAGTSIGAVVAIALAEGKLGELEAIARAGARRRHIVRYLDPLLGRGGLLGGRRIARELEAHFGGRTFADLAIPAACIAADLLTGGEVRITAGPVIPAVRASIAIPSIFAPVRVGGRMLIDGGMLQPLPLAAARALAPGLPLVAIDLMGDYPAHAAAAFPAEIAERPRAFTAGRSAFLMIMAGITAQAIRLDPPDVLIRPAIGHIGTGGFTQVDELIALGEAAALAALPAIRALAPARKSSTP